MHVGANGGAHIRIVSHTQVNYLDSVVKYKKSYIYCISTICIYVTHNFKEDHALQSKAHLFIEKLPIVKTAVVKCK